MLEKQVQRALHLVAIFVLAPFAVDAQIRPQIDGGTCSTSTLSGTYFYLLSGSVVSGSGVVAYAEFGKVIGDGNGGVSGQSYASLGGQQTTYSLTGTYIVQSNCAGSMTLTISPQVAETLSLQIVNNGQAVILATSSTSAVVVGTAYRETASTIPVQCGNGSFSGGYGYVLSGVAPVGSGALYSDAGQFVADGTGNATGMSVENRGGSVSQNSFTGTYSVASDCSGTAQVTNQNGTSNYRFAIGRDGQVALFFETDAGWTESGVFTPQFAPPQQSLVNAASFQPGAAPGSLFSIFGVGLASNPASAQVVPLPNTLGTTQILVNNTPAPLLYVSDKQINAQMPVSTPTGQPVSVIVNNGSARSNTVSVTIPPAAPGIFTYNGNQALIQNQDGSVNSSTTPAHPGDVVVAYLTGGGQVNAQEPWLTGAASPPGPSGVTVPYSVTVGRQRAQVEYLGLTPGFVGLYQANFVMPNLTPGTYPVVVTVGGVSSSAATISVGQ